MVDTRTAVIAEDDPDTRELIEMVLSQSGFEIVVAHDGPEAIAAVREYQPLLTTLDVNMPGMDGFAVAKRLREFSQTYLIMITSLTQEIDIIRGLEAGADDYLVKPFRPRELRARADSMLRRASYQPPVGGAPAEAVAPAPAAAPEPEPASWAKAAAEEFQSSIGGTQAYAGKRARREPPAPEAPPAARREPAQEQRPVQQQPAYQQPAYQQSAYQQPTPQPVHEQPGYEQPGYEQPGYQQPGYQQPAPQQPAPQPVYEQPTYQQPAPHQPVQQPPPQPVAPAQPVTQGHLLRFLGLTFDTTTGVATLGGRALDLTQPESELLLTLLRTGRRVRSKADLVLVVRGQQYVTSYFVNEADKRNVEAQIASLRRKLGDDGQVPRYIETVKGVGFRLAEAT